MFTSYSISSDNFQNRSDNFVIRLNFFRRWTIHFLFDLLIKFQFVVDCATLKKWKLLISSLELTVFAYCNEKVICKLIFFYGWSRFENITRYYVERWSGLLIDHNMRSFPSASGSTCLCWRSDKPGLFEKQFELQLLIFHAKIVCNFGFHKVLSSHIKVKKWIWNQHKFLYFLYWKN